MSGRWTPPREWLKCCQNATVKSVAYGAVLLHVLTILLIIAPVYLINVFFPLDAFSEWFNALLFYLPELFGSLVAAVKQFYYSLFLAPLFGLFTAYALLKKQRWAVWLHIGIFSFSMFQTAMLCVSVAYLFGWIDSGISAYLPRVSLFLAPSFDFLIHWFFVLSGAVLLIQAWVVWAFFAYRPKHDGHESWLGRMFKRWKNEL